MRASPHALLGSIFLFNIKVNFEEKKQTSLTVPAYPRLSQPTHVSPGLPTSLQASPRLSRPPHVSPGLPTSIPASPRLSRPPHVYPGLPTSLPASPRLSRPPHVSPGLPTSILASPDYPEREKTTNCLECHVTSRCYARRFLSDDSFAVILTILFSFHVLLHL